MSDTPKLNDLRITVTAEFQREKSKNVRDRFIAGNEFASYEAAFWVGTGFYSVDIMRWNGTAWEYAAPTLYPPQ